MNFSPKYPPRNPPNRTRRCTAAAAAAVVRRLGAGLPPHGEPTGGDRALKLERDHSKAINSEEVGRQTLTQHHVSEEERNDL